MTQRDRVCIGAVTLLVGLLAVTTGEAMHLEYVTSLGSRHAHPGLSEPPALPVTVEFGHDDTRLVLSRADGTVEAWDITRGELVRTYAAKSLIGYACDADAILIQTQDDAVQLIGLGDDARVTTIAGAYVGAIAEDGSTVLMQPEEGPVEVWDLGTLVPGRTVGAPRSGSAMALSPDGRYIATAHSLDEHAHDGAGNHTRHYVIDVWDIERDALHARIYPGVHDVPLGAWRVIFSPDGSRVAADTRNDGKSGFRVWDASTGDELMRHEDSPSWWTRALAFSPDGRFIASADERGDVVLRDATTGDELDRVNSLQMVRSLAFADDGGRLAVGLFDSSVELWQVAEGDAPDDIHLAAARGDFDAVHAMLDADPTLSNARPNDRPSPLFYAAMARNVEMISLLLEHGAIPGDGPSPLSMAMTHPWLQGAYDAARLLGDAGAVADFHAALQLGLEERVAEILRDDPSQLHRTDWGLMPIDLVTEVGNVTVGKMLIEAGADVNVFAASSFGLIDKVEAFVEADASMVNASRTEGGYAPLHCAAETGQVEVALYLLDNGADIHARNYWGFRPLHLATLSARGGPHTPGHVEIARILMERGADPHVLDDYDRTPLTFVPDSGNAELMLLFKDLMPDDDD
jgi:ankyrin repeat protein